MTIDIGRRQFIFALGGAAVTWPLAAHAQQPPMTRVGIVTIQPRTDPLCAAFDQRLRELGYVEGQNLALDYINPGHPAAVDPCAPLAAFDFDVPRYKYTTRPLYL